MTRVEAQWLELQQCQQSRAGAVGVTVGRAAQMLRMSRQAVLQYAHAGAIAGEWIEGAAVARGTRSQQLVFRKAEVRRFRQALEDQRRRRPTARSRQLGLPLTLPPAPVLRPASWHLAAFTPAMIRAGRGVKVVDRQPEGRANGNKKTAVA